MFKKVMEAVTAQQQRFNRMISGVDAHLQLRHSNSAKQTQHTHHINDVKAALSFGSEVTTNLLVPKSNINNLPISRYNKSKLHHSG